MLATRPLSVLLSLGVFVAALAIAPAAQAQGPGQIERPRSTAVHGSGSSSAPGSDGTPWGTRTEHWLAAGGALALGAVTVAIGTALYRYAVDLNTHALQLSTTQADAASSVNTARDFLLAAEVLWSVGASLAGIGLSWVIVLAFSTPAPSAAPEAAAVAPSASLRITPLGVTLEGIF